MNDQPLAKLDIARHALAECKTAMEAKQISDVAEAARVYLERTNASVDTVNEATEIRLLAERQMGAFLRQMPKNPGARGFGKSAIPSEISTIPTIPEMGLSANESHRAQKLADIPEPEFKERIAVARASGGKLTTAKVMEFTQSAKRAGEEAEKDSEQLWRLKSLWNKTNKRDRTAFIVWIKQHP